MVIMDFNEDGIDDLAYSCPGTGVVLNDSADQVIAYKDLTSTYEGLVKIELGGGKGTLKVVSNYN